MPYTSYVAWQLWLEVMNADKVSAILLHESHSALNEYFYNLLKRRNLFPSYCYSFLSTSIQTKLQALILNTWISRTLVSMGTLSTWQFSNAFLLSRWHFSNSNGINIASGHEIYDIKWFVCVRIWTEPKQTAYWVNSFFNSMAVTVCLFIINYSQISHFGTNMNIICSAPKF